MAVVVVVNAVVDAGNTPTELLPSDACNDKRRRRVRAPINTVFRNNIISPPTTARRQGDKEPEAING